METQNSNLKSQNQNSKLKSELKYRAYHFSLLVIQFVSNFPNKRLYWIIADQLLRAATSIGANIVEAKASSSKREFIKYYEIALKSANETKYWLCLLRDAKLKDISYDDLKKILDEAVEISNIIGSSLLTMKGRKKF